MLEKNKVYNTDCLEGVKNIDSETVDLILTDPPYEVNYNAKSQHLEKIDKARSDQIERDKTFVDVVPDYEHLSAEMFRILKQDTHAYIFCSDRNLSKWIISMVNAGFKHPQILVWKKNRTTFDLTFGHKYPENKEFILFFHKGWKRLNGYNVERHDFRSVLNFDSSDDTPFHSCAKPINLLMFLVKASSQKGDLCIDLFAGSGNHLISFKRLERNFIGFELSDEYFKTINERLEEEEKQKSIWSFENEV